MSRLTLDDLLDQLEQARQMAIEERRPTAMIQATVTTAKLLGMDRPQLKDVNTDAVQTISDLMNELANNDQLLTQRISHAKDEY
jgi:ABC-type branched-subunit amino acid transport system ATPase component